MSYSDSLSSDNSITPPPKLVLIQRYEEKSDALYKALDPHVLTRENIRKFMYTISYDDLKKHLSTTQTIEKFFTEQDELLESIKEQELKANKKELFLKKFGIQHNKNSSRCTIL